MPEEVKIPFGYRRVQGQLQKGDGVWDGTRFARVKKGYPFAGAQELIAIRRCAVEQIELLQAAGDHGGPQPATMETMELE